MLERDRKRQDADLRGTLMGSGDTGAASRVAKLRPELERDDTRRLRGRGAGGASLLAGTEPPAYAYPVAVAAGCPTWTTRAAL